jgi:hypothetical protein
MRILMLTAALAAIPSTASAVEIRLGLGASYWFERTGLFDLTLGVNGRIVGPLYIGGRVGAGVTTSGPNVIIPINLVVGVIIVEGLLYIEGMGGPWIAIDTGDTLRGHGALGFGFLRGMFWVGVEAGYLEPDAILGVRLGLRF